MRHLYIKTNILPRQARDKHREKHSKKRVVAFSDCSGAAGRSCQPRARVRSHSGRPGDRLPGRLSAKAGAGKAFVCTGAFVCSTKTIHLPRQARDNHRKVETKERGVFCRAKSRCQFPLGIFPLPQVRKRVSFAMPFYTKNASFCQDRLGTNIGKTLKKIDAFSLVPSSPPSSLSATSAAAAAAAAAAAVVPAKSLRFSFTAPSVAGMGCARFTFGKPLNLTAHRPLGVLIHGDGSGALVNLQVEESRGLIQSHFVRLDFAGWRTLEVRERIISFPNRRQMM